MRWSSYFEIWAVRPRLGRVLVGMTGLVAMTMVAGCGYSTESLHRTGIRTVYVEMAQSREFRRGIEFELTEALRKQIDLCTPYKNAPREKADTILSAEVLEWREAAIGHDPWSNRPRENAATLAIRYRWQDMRTGKLLRERPRFVTTVDYVQPVGENVANARLDAANKIARRIVDDMESAW